MQQEQAHGARAAAEDRAVSAPTATVTAEPAAAPALGTGEPPPASRGERIGCRGLVPIGIMWGDDDGVQWSAVDEGRQRLSETRILDKRVGRPRYLGWAGRLNGPVDNRLSSCIHCHRIAEFPLRGSMTPTPQWLFEGKDPALKGSAQGLDGSLQLALSPANFCDAGAEHDWQPPMPAEGRCLCRDYEELKADAKPEQRYVVFRDADAEVLDRLVAEAVKASALVIILWTLLAVAGVLGLGTGGRRLYRRWRVRRQRAEEM